MTKFETIASMFAFGLKCHCMGLWVDDYADETEAIPAEIDTLGLDTVTVSYINGDGMHDSSWYEMDEVWPLLRPLSLIMGEIRHNGETFVPIDFFKIRENDYNFFEFDLGNVKLINILNSITRNGCRDDVNYLPYPVVQKLKSWMFDVDGLIEKKEAIDVTTLKNDPYAN